MLQGRTAVAFDLEPVPRLNDMFCDQRVTRVIVPGEITCTNRSQQNEGREKGKNPEELPIATQRVKRAEQPSIV